MEMAEFGAGMMALNLVLNLLSYGLSIASYILTALGLYTIAKRRGISKPWLAWIPVANAWTLGCISDQYRYVVKGETKSKRKILLGLNIALYASIVAMYILLIAAAFQAVGSAIGAASEHQIISAMLNAISTVLFVFIPVMAISITYQVIYFMALYDVYKSCDPEHGVLFLVLSILFSITQPFFLFFSRKKDYGMPTRKPEPMGYIPPQQGWQPPQPNNWQQPYRNPYQYPYPNPYQNPAQNQWQPPQPQPPLPQSSLAEPDPSDDSKEENIPE